MTVHISYIILFVVIVLAKCVICFCVLLLYTMLIVNKDYQYVMW